MTQEEQLLLEIEAVKIDISLQKMRNALANSQRHTFHSLKLDNLVKSTEYLIVS
jgi:hypothetical protein